jgi:DNA-binding NtrC family response regulator
MQVVVIDDDAAILRSLEILLSTQGHRVLSFRNVDEACGYLERSPPPDVLIVDYVIPPLMGAEVLDRVRTRLPDGCRLILISGHTDLIRPQGLERMGVDAFLPKPLDFDELTELVGGAAG